MIYARATENLTGICVEGEFQDFYELVESIYRMTGLEDNYEDPYWGVKNRLLGICYDIRHAFMGDREVKFVDNNVTSDLEKWHEMIMPKQNLHYSVNILFPEAVFVAVSVAEMFPYCKKYYESSDGDYPVAKVIGLHDYVRDQAIINMFSSAVLKALGDTIGTDGFKSFYKELENARNRYSFESIFWEYVTPYVDKCNLEYLKTVFSKRKDKLRNIAKRFVKPPQGYSNLKMDFEYSAKLEHCSIYELEAPEFENYPEPEDIIW